MTNNVLGQSLVSGVILDENGDTRPGVAVFEESSQTGVVTDPSGKFDFLTSKDTSILLVHFIGYFSQKINIHSDSDLKITMCPDTTIKYDPNTPFTEPFLDYKNRFGELDRIDFVCIKKLEPPTSIETLQSYDWITWTSGVVEKSQSDNLFKPESKGFHGVYNLKKTSQPVGQLFIHSANTPTEWKSDDKNQTLVSIITDCNEIEIWDRKLIGTSRSELIKFVGKRFHYTKGQTIYADFENYEAIFWLDQDTVRKLKVDRIK